MIADSPFPANQDVSAGQHRKKGTRRRRNHLDGFRITISGLAIGTILYVAGALSGGAHRDWTSWVLLASNWIWAAITHEARAERHVWRLLYDDLRAWHQEHEQTFPDGEVWLS